MISTIAYEFALWLQQMHIDILQQRQQGQRPYNPEDDERLDLLRQTLTHYLDGSRTDGGPLPAWFDEDQARKLVEVSLVTLPCDLMPYIGSCIRQMVEYAQAWIASLPVCPGRDTDESDSEYQDRVCDWARRVS